MSAANFVDVLVVMMEFQIGDGAIYGTNGFAVQTGNEADERPSTRQGFENMGIAHPPFRVDPAIQTPRHPPRNPDKAAAAIRRRVATAVRCADQCPRAWTSSPRLGVRRSWALDPATNLFGSRRKADQICTHQSLFRNDLKPGDEQDEEHWAKKRPRHC